MTDHTDLIARLRKDDLFWEAPITCRSDAADALEAAQAEIEAQQHRIQALWMERDAALARIAELTKLSQGVSVEPFWIRQEDVCGNSVGPDIPYYGQDDFTTAIAAARVKAYDECTKLCDPDALGLEQGDDCATGVYRVEKAIRALKEKQE